jgi:hypothetical protein
MLGWLEPGTVKGFYSVPHKLRKIWRAKRVDNKHRPARERKTYHYTKISRPRLATVRLIEMRKTARYVLQVIIAWVC